ncbi:MAG: hypothetical protein NZ929_03495 [Aigarchaeota archaeon]|nr:hypothetical protein [Aigarchaeota archaeon]MDW7986951.1 hypothetical protein [Nitrososphaerota archaeon]
MLRNSEIRTTVIVAVSTVFGALSALLAIMPLSFSFPIIPYLKFDIAEIPVVTAFIGFGPIPGIVSSITYWLILNLFGEWAPIGPAMKFLAVTSMLAGFWISYKLASRFRISYILVFLFGGLMRVLATTIVNYLLLVAIAPFFLEYAVSFVSLALGLKIDVGIGGLMLVLAFTAVYNILHVIFSLFPSIVLVKSFSRQGLFLNLKEPWIMVLLKEKKSKPSYRLSL